MVIETDKHELLLFDVSDVLFPTYLMTLPHPKNTMPYTKTYNFFYQCISGTHIIIPFKEVGSETPGAKFKAYLYMYDLYQPYHTILFHTHFLGEMLDLKSVVGSSYAGFDYLYIYADDYIKIYKVFTGHLVSLSEASTEQLRHAREIPFQIYVNNSAAEGRKESTPLLQNFTIHTVKTGLKLKAETVRVPVYATDDTPVYKLNLDEYFEGFRLGITCFRINGDVNDSQRPSYNTLGSDGIFTAPSGNNTSLSAYNILGECQDELSLTYGIVGKIKSFEISNSHFNNEEQKALIKLNSTIYLFVDCQYFIYLSLTSDIALIVKSASHKINGTISRVKYFEDYKFDKESNGTAVVLYLINGCEEIISLCSLSLTKDPDCSYRLQYPLGKVLNYFMYTSTRENKTNNYLVIGSVTFGSQFSLIRVFQDQSTFPGELDYRYIGEISSTTLESPRFCLDSVSMFSHFLIFSNHSALFVLDFEEYVDNPKWFTPKFVREISLDYLIAQYSGGMFEETKNITRIHIEDT